MFLEEHVAQPAPDVGTKRTLERLGAILNTPRKERF